MTRGLLDDVRGAMALGIGFHSPIRHTRGQWSSTAVPRLLLGLLLLTGPIACCAQGSPPPTRQPTWREARAASYDFWGRPIRALQMDLAARAAREYSEARSRGNSDSMQESAQRLLAIHVQWADWAAARNDLQLVDRALREQLSTGHQVPEPVFVADGRAAVACSRGDSWAALRHVWSRHLREQLAWRVGFTLVCLVLGACILMLRRPTNDRRLVVAMAVLASMPCAGWITEALKPVLSWLLFGSPLAYRVESVASGVMGYVGTVMAPGAYVAVAALGLRHLWGEHQRADQAGSDHQPSQPSAPAPQIGRRAGVALAVVLAFVVGINPITWSSVTQRPYLATQPPWGRVVWPLLAVIVYPVIEEIVFRRRIYGSLRGRIGPMHALLYSACLFSAIHGSIFDWRNHAWAGIVLAYEYELTGSVALCALTHALLNLSVVLGVR